MVCSDQDKKWFPQRKLCRPTMERLAAEWRYAEMHEAKPFHDGHFKSWAEKRSLTHPYRYDDGVTIFVAETDLEPDADWLGNGLSESPI